MSEVPDKFKLPVTDASEIPFWDSLQRDLQTSIPSDIVNILEVTRYNSEMTLRNMTQEDITEIENFCRTTLHSILPVEQHSHYYGVFSAFPEKFVFMPGHKKLVLLIGEHLRKQHNLQSTRSKRPDLTRSLTMDTQGGNATERLPDELMLTIFRYLSEDELLKAEQVCLRWKSIVNMCFATAQRLKMFRTTFDLQTMRRYGASLKSLELVFNDDDVECISEIANSFPNLLSISLWFTTISNDDVKALTAKCCKLTRISLCSCDLNDEKIAILLKGFSGLKYLELSCFDAIVGKCFRELGSNLEHLILTDCQLTKVGTSHIFSKCINLKSIELNPGFECDANIFTTFCKKAPIQSLKIKNSQWSKTAFLSLSHLSLLEELKLSECEYVDSDVLIAISRGCPILKNVSLSNLPLVCDRGLKAFAQLRHLTYLRCTSTKKMTDESLIEIAKSGLLKRLIIDGCDVSDRGVSAILAQCPQLGYLSVDECSGVSDSTVDAAIQAVESRSSSTLDQTMIFPRKAAAESSCLFMLCLPAKRLNRYKEDFSHPLIFLRRWLL